MNENDALLSIRDLHVKAGERDVLRGINLDLPAGQVHAIMGPNGSGKSSLSHVLAGKPGYTVTAGSVSYQGQDLLALPPDGRRFELDARGRLALMSPDSARRHRVPLSVLVNLLGRSLDWPRQQLHVAPTLALPRILGLKTRRLLPASRLGPKSVEPRNSGAFSPVRSHNFVVHHAT